MDEDVVRASPRSPLDRMNGGRKDSRGPIAEAVEAVPAAQPGPCNPALPQPALHKSQDPKKRTNVKVAVNQWHTLRVDFEGAHFTVTLNGKKAIDWDDHTFKEAGHVGV